MKFSVNGTKHEFDENKMTFAEARAMEKRTGYPIGQLSKHTSGDDMEMTVIQAFIWVAMKRDEPELQFSDLDDMSLGDIEFHDDEEPEQDPTQGAEDSTPAA